MQPAAGSEYKRAWYAFHTHACLRKGMGDTTAVNVDALLALNKELEDRCIELESAVENLQCENLALSMCLQHSREARG